MPETALEKNDPIAVEAVKYVNERKQAWELATVFVTDKIAFRMRDLIKQLRKNYFGLFDSPTDSVTGRKKIWIPLTEYVCDNVVKNIDLDTKDINFRSKNGKARGITSLIRNLVKDYLDNTFFGEYLDDLERTLAIDGTGVWKTYEEMDDEYEGKTMCVQDVDLLNFYIDPTAKSIHDHCKKDIVIERGLMTPTAIRAMKGWFNTKDVVGFTGLNINDRGFGVSMNAAVVDTKQAEIYEAWGQIPKFLITGVEADREEFVYGHIVISNIGRSPIVHLIEQIIQKKGKKAKSCVPYEESWYARVRGRWYGRGPAEKVMMLQLWLNIIVNIRINRSYVTQLGIFKIKKGSGVTAQMLSKLTVNGGIVVKDMEDIEQMVVQEASPASYNDENVIQQWSQRITSLFESVTGEAMPSQTTATNGVISNRSASSQFVFVKKGIGMFLQRWLKRHVFPFLSEHMKADDIIRVTGEVEELRELDERLANQLVYEKVEELTAAGHFVDAAQVEKERQRIMDKLAAQGKDRFVSLLEEINFADHDVQVFITNEEADKGVLIQNLVQVLQTLPNLQDSGIDPVAVANAVFDLMGIDTSQLRSKRTGAPQGLPQPQPGGQATAPMQGKPVSDMVQQVQNAATL
jgi:hypothetical protein